MARDPTSASGQGWQCWSIGTDDTAVPANHHEVRPATTPAQPKTKLNPKAQPDSQVKIPISSSEIPMKKDGWQFWALGDQPQTANHDEDSDNDERPSTSFSAPIGEDGSAATFAANTAPTKKKGWKFWAIGVAEDGHRTTNVDPDVLFSDDKLDKPAVALLKSQEPQEDSRDDCCAWRYWSQMQQQHRDEEPTRRSADFDSDKEAWQFWAIGVSSDNASQISLLTEGFETDPTPMVKIVKIKKLQPAVHEIGWRYWSSMKKDAAALKSNTGTKQGWQFWAIGGAKKVSVGQEFIASERFEVGPSTPIVKPVAPTITVTPNEGTGWRYWSNSIVPTEDVGMAVAVNVTSKQGWQFWAIGGTKNQCSKRQVPITRVESEVVKTKSRSRQMESLDESGWRYWSQIEKEEGAELMSVNSGNKQGWQFWALGVSNQSITDDHKSLLSEREAAASNVEPPTPATNSGREAESSSSREEGWRYWSRMKQDNHEDLLPRNDSTSFGSVEAKFTATPKFYSLKYPHSLSRIEEEERASKDDLSCYEVLPIERKGNNEKQAAKVAASPKQESEIPRGSKEAKEGDSSSKPKQGGIFGKILKKFTLVSVGFLVGLIVLGKQDVLLLTGL